MVQVARHIRHVRLEEVTVLLDTRAGDYLMFDEVATLMWEGICEAQPEAQVVAGIAARYDVDVGQASTDFGNFLSDCRVKNFIGDDDDAASGDASSAGISASLSSPRQEPVCPRFLTLRAWLALFKTWRLLKASGFHALYQSAHVIALRQAGNPDPALLARAEAAFLRAENFFILKNAPQDCLPRSMALFRFLRAIGLPVQHRIGVERYPLSMHAWVDCDGEPVLDDPIAGRMTVITGTAA